MIPEGTYTARAFGRPVFAFAKTGAEYVAIDFRVTAGEYVNETAPWKGWLTPRAAPYTTENLRTLGWDGDTLTDLGPLDAEVQIVVEHEVYDGKTYAKVRYINAIGGVPDSARLSEEQIRELDKRLKGEAEAPATGDDDLPW